MVTCKVLWICIMKLKLIFKFSNKSIKYYQLVYRLLPQLELVTKFIGIRYIFIKKSLKKCLTCSNIPKNFPPPGSMLCQAWKSYVRQWWLGMNK